MLLLTAPVEGEWREPAGRRDHSTAVVGEAVYLWAGEHETPLSAKMRALVEVFNVNTGCWEQRTTRGTPPLGVRGYSCVAVRNDLYYFGGASADNDHHNSVHTLSTPTLQWRMLAPTTSEDGALVGMRRLFRNNFENNARIIGLRYEKWRISSSVT